MYPNAARLPDAGWHFSYLASNDDRISRITRKVGAFAHGELDSSSLTSASQLQRALAKDQPWWKGTGTPTGDVPLHRVAIDETFPSCVRAEPVRWQPYVLDGAGDWRYELRYRLGRLQRAVRRRAQRTANRVKKVTRPRRPR